MEKLPTYKDEGMFEEEFLDGCRNIIQNFLPGFIDVWNGSPCEISFGTVLTCESVYGADWIDLETAWSWIERYPAATATSFDYSQYVKVAEAQFGVFPGEINPFRYTQEYARWMVISGIDFLFQQCDGMFNIWNAQNVSFDFTATIALYYLLEELDIPHKEEDFEWKPMNPNTALYGVNYNMFNNAWRRDVDYYDSDDESWFCVRGDKIGRITCFAEWVDATQYAIDIFQLTAGCYKIDKGTVYGEGDRDARFPVARQAADKMMV